ncbi:hypothetical protein MM239_17875 [Belliella sp. DSM 111904]|uniref:DUF676 domain-containing protein n=1 Tax=Belliella filtrata TaxID=2923435 RepID=A0ABS9V4C5_9BACT|nr:hypothetical protein [Belliella filtrata]MCH7411269.1 hypothetical protein [Belliella filtrata]
MKRKVTMFVFLIGMVLPVSGQQTAVDFSGLNNPDWIPTGILFENNPDFWTFNRNIHPWFYDGVSDSVCNREIFISLYDFFYFASFTRPNSTLPIISDSLENDIRGTGRDPSEVRLGLMEFSYESLSDSATNAGIVAWDTVDYVAYILDSLVLYDTIYEVDASGDTVGLHTIVDTVVYFDPDSIGDLVFDTHNLFAMAAFNDRIDLKSPNEPFTFFLESIYRFHDGSGSGNYQISVDGGITYQTLIPNVPLTFNNHNLGTGVHQIKVRRDSHAESLKGTFGLDVVVMVEVPDYQIADFPPIQCPDLDTSDGVGTGVATFFINDLSNGSLKKPVIIVEGMDILSFRSTENDWEYGSLSDTNLQYGAYDYVTFFSGQEKVRRASNPYENGDSLLHFLMKENDYDVVYVDFQSSRTRIQRNANFLMRIIQHVNAELEANQSNEQIAVMGVGTGGVIARVALREMELQNCCHNTRMFTSFDAPHKGFNIPLRLQYFMDHTRVRFYMPRNKRIRTFYQYVVKNPLFAQLLIENIDEDDAQHYGNFMNYLNEIGMPEAPRNFATTNGNDGGITQHIQDGNTNLIMPGDKFFEHTVKFFAPVVFPTTQNVMPSLIAGLVLTGPNNFYLAHAVPYLGGEGAQGDLEIYKYGPSIWVNTGHLALHYTLWTKGLFGLKAIVTKHLVALASAVMSGCTFCPPIIFTSEQVQKVLYGGFITTLLVANQHLNNTLNGGSWMNVQETPFPTLAYDRAPGGRYDFPELLNRRSQKSIGDIDRPEHGFVSVLSALNIDSTNLTMDVLYGFQSTDHSK